MRPVSPDISIKFPSGTLQFDDEENDPFGKDDHIIEVFEEEDDEKDVEDETETELYVVGVGEYYC